MSQQYEQSVELVPAETVAHLSAAVLMAALTAVLAQVSIPLAGGVPFSFQPFAVFFAGLLLGPMWGGFAMLLYFVVGLAGAPVFSNAGAGLGYVLGPTGGFLIGFMLAAVVAGAIAHRSLSPRPIDQLSAPVAALALGVAIVPLYLIGVPWLAFIGGELTLLEAATAMAPLFASDFVKAGLVVGVIAGGTDLLHSV